MRPLPRRRPSRSAFWALRFALFLPVLSILSILAHRGGTADTPTFLVLVVIIFLIAVVGLLFVFLAFRSLWVKGKRGGRRATWAFFLIALVLAPYVYGATLWIAKPKVAEVSTDLIDPPAFRTELLEYGSVAPEKIAANLTDAYPNITARRYNATADVVYDKVISFAAERGWKEVVLRGRVGTGEDLIAEFSDKSTILALPRQIVFRVRDESETTLLDIRSKSFFGTIDLGSNAALIADFVAELDFALIGQIEQ